MNVTRDGYEVGCRWWQRLPLIRDTNGFMCPLVSFLPGSTKLSPFCLSPLPLSLIRILYQAQSAMATTACSFGEPCLLPTLRSCNELTVEVHRLQSAASTNM